MGQFWSLPLRIRAGGPAIGGVGARQQITPLPPTGPLLGSALPVGRFRRIVGYPFQEAAAELGFARQTA